jgi:2'-5' RNA ligase
VRLFAAIELSDRLKKSLHGLVDRLSAFDRDVRWVKRDQMHVTLKFLGEVADGDAPRISDALATLAAECAPFDVTLDTCGCFPPRGKVRVIWGGMSEPPGALMDCAKRCEEACADLGFPREKRPFAAHVTVGRVRDDRTNGRLRGAIEKLRPAAVDQRVESVTLFQSELRPEGARYVAMGRFPFGERA